MEHCGKCLSIEIQQTATCNMPSNHRGPCGQIYGRMRVGLLDGSTVDWQGIQVFDPREHAKVK
jgi:hypothetical protein